MMALSLQVLVSVSLQSAVCSLQMSDMGSHVGGGKGEMLK